MDHHTHSMYKMICIPRRRPRRHLASTRYTFICTPQVAAVVACMQHHTCISTRVHVRTSYIYTYLPGGHAVQPSQPFPDPSRERNVRNNTGGMERAHRTYNGKRKIHNLTYTYVYAHASPCTNLTELNGKQAQPRRNDNNGADRAQRIMQAT